MKQIIEQAIKKVLKQLGLPVVKFTVEHPENMAWGDYSTNVGIIINSNKDTPSLGKGVSLEICERLKAEESLKKIASEINVANSGFINISIQSEVLISLTNKVLKGNWKKTLAEKTFLLEHTSPNPNKAMHLGHLRNNLTGMAIANIFEHLGAKVIKDCIDNNRGIAIAKLMWGYLKFGRKDKKQIIDIDYWFNHQDEWQTPEDTKQRPDRFVDELYVKGSEDCNNEKTEKKIRQLVIDWEAKDEKNWSLWKKVLQYSYEGQILTLKRLGSLWDKVWYEHEHYQQGKDLVKKGRKIGVFKRGKLGAIVTDLKKYGLDDTVVIKGDGTALYITQDLALTKLKRETYKPEKLFWVIGPEQSLALKQMFACCEQLGIIKVKDCNHVAYGYMSLKGKGKMSSRQGTVVYIDDLLDEAKKQIQSSFKCSDELAEKIGVGAVKYSILKVGRMKNIAFDFKESLSFEGNSGPYLQYTYARAKSVLAKSQFSTCLAGRQVFNFQKKPDLNSEEAILLRTLYRFEEVIVQAAEELAPNKITEFLYDLAQKFNGFYNQHRIVGNDFRLWLTQATAAILKKGLALLGISAPEKM